MYTCVYIYIYVARYICIYRSLSQSSTSSTTQPGSAAPAAAYSSTMVAIPETVSATIVAFLVDCLPLATPPSASRPCVAWHTVSALLRQLRMSLPKAGKPHAIWLRGLSTAHQLAGTGRESCASVSQMNIRVTPSLQEAMYGLYALLPTTMSSSAESYASFLLVKWRHLLQSGALDGTAVELALRLGAFCDSPWLICVAHFWGAGATAYLSGEIEADTLPETTVPSITPDGQDRWTSSRTWSVHYSAILDPTLTTSVDHLAQGLWGSLASETKLSLKKKYM